MTEQPLHFRSYAGIGSRKTPDDVLDLMAEVGGLLATKGFVLRSGGAPGADQAFLTGAIGWHNTRQHAVETYLPWESFERETLAKITNESASHVARSQPAEWTFPIARLHHPAWGSVKETARPLHARNVHQILGWKEYLRDGKIVYDRSKFVICWTPDGACNAAETTRETGGTGQAIRMADAYRVPVFNLAKDEHRVRIENMLLDAYADKED